MSAVTYVVGDVFERLAQIPDGSVDLVLTSPPFLALRSYLPADHPDKAKEIGSEPTPREFIDTMLALSAEFRRVLAPHGSIAIEFGDTYSGSGGAGGDYAEGGLREGQNAFKAPKQSRSRSRDVCSPPTGSTGGQDWPLEKSMCGIPHAFHLSLAYGFNVLNRKGPDSPAGLWRVRNVVAWCRPNPAVGSLGDKYRPATSYMTIACVSRDRYFDGDAVRVPSSPNTNARTAKGVERRDNDLKTSPDGNRESLAIQHTTGDTRPPYDHVGLMGDEADMFLDEGWLVSTEAYSGSHYATWPRKLLDRPILAMCPQRVCSVCSEPSRRIVEASGTGQNLAKPGHPDDATKQVGAVASTHVPDYADRRTLGWSDCGHDAWRRGVVLDPFGGSGTTGVVAAAHGRDAILIDLDERNADLARERVGMFLNVVPAGDIFGGEVTS